jgi:GT2 family glycosyltransferase/glycosyltransferase involved in cell wall biosynthesis
MDAKRIQGAILLVSLRSLASVVAKFQKALKKAESLTIDQESTPSSSDFSPVIHFGGKVAVAIPTYNGWDWTSKCIESIRKTRDQNHCDIWVIDDASSDGTSERLAERYPEVRIIKNSENLGFLKSCNNAFLRLRNYEWVFLLNNDTEVHEGFLLEALLLAAKKPRAALIGSKLVYPDGSLQEAGAFFWQSGNAWNFGRNADPSRTEFNIDRQVDYCSGAAILLRTASLFEVGLFSEEFLPAYFEDSDLAFKLRDAGFETWYAHRSVVTHYEGKSHGTSTASGIKKYQIENSIKFSSKWASILTNHSPEAAGHILDAAFRLSPELKPKGTFVYFEGMSIRVPGIMSKFIGRLASFYSEHKDESPKSLLFPHSSFLKKQSIFHQINPEEFELTAESIPKESILFIENNVPAPDTNAGDLSTISYIKLLVEMGERVTFMPVLPFIKNKYSEALEEMGVKVFRPISGFDSWISTNAENIKKVWISRPDFAKRIIESIKEGSETEILYYTQDLHFLRTFRQAVQTKNLVKLASSIHLWFKERWIFNNVSKVLSVSPVETNVIKKISRRAEVETLQPFFYSQSEIISRAPADFVGKTNLVFLGGYSHTPNVDAVNYLVAEVMPEVWKARSDIHVTVAGFGPPPEILNLASLRVHVVGQVESLESLFEEYRALVAPLRYGAGVKGKVIEAMRLGLPVIGTKIAFEAIPVEDGISALFGETPNELAAQILRLIESDSLAGSLSKNGTSVIATNYSTARAQSDLGRVLRDKGI